MGNHGTAYSLGQYNEVHAAVTRALPKALEGTDPKRLTKTLQKGGEALERKLGECLRALVSVLTFLRKVNIPAQPAVITSEEYFEGAGVKWMGDNFKAEFLGLEVPAIEAAELAVSRLEEDSLDEPIRNELGKREQVSVSQFCAFLKANRESQEWFIFYLRGKGGIWAVSAHWDFDFSGWRVDADSVAGPGRWDQGGQVVSQV